MRESVTFEHRIQLIPALKAFDIGVILGNILVFFQKFSLAVSLTVCLLTISYILCVLVVFYKFILMMISFELCLVFCVLVLGKPKFFLNVSVTFAKL